MDNSYFQMLIDLIKAKHFLTLFDQKISKVWSKVVKYPSVLHIKICI